MENDNNKEKVELSQKIIDIIKNSIKIQKIFNKDKIYDIENKKEYINNSNKEKEKDYMDKNKNKDKDTIINVDIDIDSKKFNKNNNNKNKNNNNKIFKFNFDYNFDFNFKFFNLKISDFLLKTTLTGILIGAFALIIEHPLESIKVQWQSEIKFKKSKDIVKNIYLEKGIIGFYRGLLPNLIRRSCKNFYRWPLMLYLPNIFNKINNNIFPYWNSEGLNKIQTGIFLANFETFFVSPIERLKVYFMTYTPFRKAPYNKFDSLLFMFYLDNKGRIIKELFRGLDASLYRSNLSWVSFLYLEYEGKRFLLEFNCKSELSFFDLLVVSVFVMIGNLGLSNFYFYFYFYFNLL
jgi:hypothetical protein